MSINRIVNIGERGAPGPHPDPSSRESRVTGHAAEGKGAVDSLELWHEMDLQAISDAARALARRAASETTDPSRRKDDPPTGITPTRIRIITGRLATGFYDTAEVRNQVAAAVRSDLSGPEPS